LRLRELSVALGRNLRGPASGEVSGADIRLSGTEIRLRRTAHSRAGDIPLRAHTRAGADLCAGSAVMFLRQCRRCKRQRK